MDEEAILKLPRFIKGTVFITLSVYMILSIHLNTVSQLFSININKLTSIPETFPRTHKSLENRH